MITLNRENKTIDFVSGEKFTFLAHKAYTDGKISLFLRSIEVDKAATLDDIHTRCCSSFSQAQSFQFISPTVCNFLFPFKFGFVHEPPIACIVKARLLDNRRI